MAQAAAPLPAPPACAGGCPHRPQLVGPLGQRLPRLPATLGRAPPGGGLGGLDPLPPSLPPLLGGLGPAWAREAGASGPATMLRCRAARLPVCLPASLGMRRLGPRVQAQPPPPRCPPTHTGGCTHYRVCLYTGGCTHAVCLYTGGCTPGCTHCSAGPNACCVADLGFRAVRTRCCWACRPAGLRSALRSPAFDSTIWPPPPPHKGGGHLHHHQHNPVDLATRPPLGLSCLGLRRRPALTCA